MSLEIVKICRTCLALDGGLLSIYDNKGSTGGDCVADMLGDLTTNTPKRSDGMPEKVCLSCISEINRCYSFKMKCENSDRTLRQLLNISSEEKVVEQPLVEKPIIIANTPIKAADEQKKPQKRKADPCVKIILEDRVDESPEIYSVHAEEELEASYFVIDSNDEEEEEEDENENENTAELQKHVSEDSANSDNFDYLFEKYNIRQQRNKKPELKCSQCPMNFVHPRNLTKHMQKRHNITNVDPQPLTEKIDEEHEEFQVEFREIEEVAIKVEETLKAAEQCTVKNNIANMDTQSQDQEEAEHEEYELEFQQMDDTDVKDVDLRTKKTRMHDHRCPNCGLGFAQDKSLSNHIKRGKCTGKLNIASEDKKTLVNSKEVHMVAEREEVEHKQFQLEFEQMEESFVKEPLNEEEEAPKQELRCPNCGAGFAHQKSLTIHFHRGKCTSEEHSCPQCNKVFISEENLREHIKTHTQKITCNDCNETFVSKELFARHRVEKHKMRNLCPICKKVFTMLSTLKDHMRIHSGERPFLCPICGKGFTQNANLKQHIMRHNNTKPFKCSECSRSFVSKGELFSHVRSHTGDHPFVCDTCQAAFTTSSSLLKHKRTHTGERPYGCDLCPMRFTALNTLKNHRRTHTGEKPFKCKFCMRGFAQKSDCTIHMRTHTGERRYVCQICGSAFQQSGTLRTHMKTHRDVKQDAKPVVDWEMSDKQQPIEADQTNEEAAVEEIMHFAIEECSSENNDFPGE